MKTLYHLRLNKKIIRDASIVLLPGDPDRVPKIAQFLDHPNALESNREWNSYIGELQGIPILIVSTGVGGPATSICADELAQIGIRTFIRVGTTGAIQPHIKVGDVIITSASVRSDGASKDFAPIEYPAAADFDVTSALVQSAKASDCNFHVGITASTDTFYQGQERYDSFSGSVPPRLKGSLKEWQRLNVLNYEMESATLLTMCASMGLKAGCVTGVLVNRTIQENIDSDIVASVELKAISVAVNAVKNLIKVVRF
ncbi:uridine phosphorylase [Desulfonema magnum]|uniref:Uridine phosphorylase n=1 Tax=Desulfonema magnum TaxID=45655 RepID=A0A975BW50_9BACT|nr:uridine phosphorylase [Desulfonema magnum]QTA92753.1 Uridine phosphorylase [Desulfonema magnum]